MGMMSGLAPALFSRWMVWNLFLAILPWVISLGLFRAGVRRSPLWWLGVLVFLAFLPNAPYVLTDFIHLEHDLAQVHSELLDTLVVVPRYCIFMLLGFGAYVLSLMRVGDYLKRQGHHRWVGPTEIMLHGLCAAGVYLGRVERFNSWDIVTRLDVLLQGVADNLTHPYAWMFMAISLGAIALLYRLAKYVLLALQLQHRHWRSLNPHPYLPS
jgi:uncharacterized membrane protein